MYHISFLWYFTHGISETWVLPVFIFSWLWPQLYYLFRVFSVVNIYKTLNKLFRIAFHNLPIHVSMCQGWGTEKSHSNLSCVTDHVNSLFIGESRSPGWFAGFVLFCFVLFFKSSKSSRFGDLQMHSVAKWRINWRKVLFYL